MPKYFCFTVLHTLLLIVATNLFAQTEAEKSLPSLKIGDIEIVAVQDGRYDFPAALFNEVDQDVLKKIVPGGIAEGSTMTFLLKGQVSATGQTVKTMLFDIKKWNNNMHFGLTL